MHSEVKVSHLYGALCCQKHNALSLQLDRNFPPDDWLTIDGLRPRSALLDHDRRRNRHRRVQFYEAALSTLTSNIHFCAPPERSIASRLRISVRAGEEAHRRMAE